MAGDDLAEPVFNRSILLSRLDAAPASNGAVVGASSEMALLMGGAALLGDEAEFMRVREAVLARAATALPEVRGMRLYCLAIRGHIGVPMETPDQHDRYERRLLAFQADSLDGSSRGLAHYPIDRGCRT